MGKKNLLAIALLTLTLSTVGILSGCSTADDPSPTPPAEDHVDVPFTRHGSLVMSRAGSDYNEIAIEIADTDSSRTRGLMQRDGLPDQSGMLFVFEIEKEQGFWMANTRIALDLIFIRSDGSVQRVAKYVQAMSLETVLSNGPAQYVLEVSAGVADSMGITEGDLMVWSRDATE